MCFSSVSISHRRVMLFKLSEEVSDSELKEFKFFLERKIPKCKLHDNSVRPGMSPRWVTSGGSETRGYCFANLAFKVVSVCLFICMLVEVWYCVAQAKPKLAL